MSYTSKFITLKILILNRIAYVLPNFPEHRLIYLLFERIRQFCWVSMFKSIGKNTRIRSKTKIIGYQKISIGSHGIIGPNSILNASSEILIGDYFLSGPQLIIYTSEHGIVAQENTPFIFQKTTSEPVMIGSNVYLGARVTILKGVSIGNNVIIATGSVVVKNIPSDELWGGVPAKKIKSL